MNSAIGYSEGAEVPEDKTEVRIVYGFMYNDNIHESAWCTMSLHESREGAQKALEAHKAKARSDFETYVRELEEYAHDNFGVHQDWSIHEFEILP